MAAVTENLERIKKMMYKINSGSAQSNISIHPLAIEEFAKLIEDDEEILFFSSGSREGKNRNGMVFVTNKRFILCLRLFMAYVEQFQYESVTSVDYKTNWLGQGIIEINSYGDKVRFNYYEATQLTEVVTYIKNKMLEAKQPKIQTFLVQNEEDFISKLERLAKLREQGIITEEEFLEQKKKLLQ